MIAKLNFQGPAKILVRAQGLVIESLANAIRDSDQVALDDRNSGKVFGMCQYILQSRAREGKKTTDGEQVYMIALKVWDYLRYQMTDDQ